MCLNSRTILSISLALVASVAAAQDFPEGSQVPSAAELRELVSGKVFSVKTAINTWRLQIDKDGYFYVNVGGYSDSGSWLAEDGKWCTKPRKSNTSCNAMRISNSELYMKRDNGEIVKLVPQ